MKSKFKEKIILNRVVFVIKNMIIRKTFKYIANYWKWILVLGINIFDRNIYRRNISKFFL